MEPGLAEQDYYQKCVANGGNMENTRIQGKELIYKSQSA